MVTKRKQKSKRPALLSHSRPPTIYNKPPTSLSSRATRSLIRSHHRLNKELTKATADGNNASAATIQAQIEKQGGLQAYQTASATGQRSERGGDSSKVLMEWLASLHKERLGDDERCQLRMLEVGALKTDNACSRSPLFDVTRIDLHAQAPGILQQDFMQRPLPSFEGEKFDVISLSLVLNYVPDAGGRGAMLERTCSFLRTQEPQGPKAAQPLIDGFFPSLFLVLPAPCVTNSRYLTEELLTAIMVSLGYTMLRRKMSAKLVYSLWRYQGREIGRRHRVEGRKAFRKDEIRWGGKRNNFAIVL
ncbi:hypothetical protein MMC16_002388 [Acarospora aff. strigata]|nr:hypothetical protein [Acarospora aff. strigata]